MSSATQAQPLVTVIVPTIGRPEFIVDTIRSVLAQSYICLDILISDNAPSQPTQALLSSAGIDDTRIRIVEHKTRLGFSAHMNVCISEARGTYLMIVSDDDQIVPAYVACMVALMESDSQITVCLGRQVQISEHDRGLLHGDHFDHQCQIIDGVEFLTGSLGRKLTTGVLTYISMFVRRREILKLGGYKNYPDGSHADNFIVFSLAMAGKIALAPCLMFYRVYLSSFGLRTTFPALLEATQGYTCDTRHLLQRSTLTQLKRKNLAKLVHAACSSLLFNRIRVVYRYRLTPFELLSCIATQ